MRPPVDKACGREMILARLDESAKHQNRFPPKASLRSITDRIAADDARATNTEAKLNEYEHQMTRKSIALGGFRRFHVDIV